MLNSFLGILIFVIGLANINLEKQQKSNNIKEITITTYSVINQGGHVSKDDVTMTQKKSFFKDGRIESTTHFDQNQDVAWKEVFEYDSQRLTGSKFYNNEEETFKYSIFETDEQGRKTKMTAFDTKTDSILYDEAFQYLEGNIVREGYIDHLDEFIWTMEYKYDELGNELGYTFFDYENSKRIKTVYRFKQTDEYNNWTEKEILDGKEVVAIEIRKLEYYAK